MSAPVQTEPGHRSLTLPAPSDLAPSEPGASATGQTSHIIGTLNRPFVWLIVATVWTYRVTLGWLLGGHCRFQPTCSQYMLDAVKQHGPWRGGWRGLKRVLRCHPFGGHGYDPA